MEPIPSAAQTRNAQFKSATREWIESIIIAFILAMFIRTFFFQAFRIPSGSMRMTLLEGDRLLVNKLYYGALMPMTHYRLPGISHPKRGDIIVFKFPEDPKRDFIKRLVAVGGEVVEIKFGDIYVNGELVVDPVIKNIYYYNRGDYGEVNKRITVPQGYYFVLGDNSGSSHDSRYWGFVPQDNIIGKAEVIYWPPNRVRFIK
jgi:signal peptidase I